MDSSLEVVPILNIPVVKQNDDIPEIILDTLEKNNQLLKNGDIICVASKIISIAEKRLVDLNTVNVTNEALQVHKTIKRKDPRVLQLIINETSNSKLIRYNENWIGGWNHLGRFGTSAGIDKLDEDTAINLPVNPDLTAKKISEKINNILNIKVAVMISDSEGREDIAGATQICIGLYGLAPVRKENNNQETTCDMLAAAAGIVMGQRGNNIPAVIIRGYKYNFDESAKLSDALWADKVKPLQK